MQLSRRREQLVPLVSTARHGPDFEPADTPSIGQDGTKRTSGAARAALVEALERDRIHVAAVRHVLDRNRSARGLPPPITARIAPEKGAQQTPGEVSVALGDSESPRHQHHMVRPDQASAPIFYFNLYFSCIRFPGRKLRAL